MYWLWFNFAHMILATSGCAGKIRHLLIVCLTKVHTIDWNPDGVPMRSMDFIRWYNPSQAYTCVTCVIPTADLNIFKPLTDLIIDVRWSIWNQMISIVGKSKLGFYIDILELLWNWVLCMYANSIMNGEPRGLGSIQSYTILSFISFPQSLWNIHFLQFTI